MFKKIWLLSGALIAFMMCLPPSSAQAELILDLDSVTSSDQNSQFTLEFEWLAGDDSLLSIRNLSDVGVASISRLTLTGSASSNWSFDQLDYQSGTNALVLGPDQENGLVRGPADILWTSGLGINQSSVFSFDIDHIDANQTRNLGVDLKNSEWSVLLTDGTLGSLTWDGPSTFDENAAYVNGSLTAVPEPSSFLLLGGTLLGGVFVRRRRQKRSALQKE